MRLSARPLGLALVCFTLGCPVDDKEVGTEGPGDTGATGATGTGGNSETGGADSGAADTGVTGSDGGEPNTSTTVPGNPTEGPIDSASETGFSDSGDNDSGDDDSGSDGGDLPEPPPGCEIDTPDNSGFFTIDPGVEVEEVCDVGASEMVGDDLKLSLDCPLLGGALVVQVESGPLPAAPPQIGESFAVYYQRGDFDGFFELANPELLFLRRDDTLVYASIRGFFIRDQDFARVEEQAAPIGIELISGPCPHVATGWDGIGDGTSCFGEAVSQIELSADALTVLGEGESAILAVGGKSYAAELRQARHGQDCVDLDEQIRYTLALALQ